MSQSRFSPKKRFASEHFSKKFVLIFIVILVAVFAGLELTNTTHFLHKSVPATKVIVTATGNGKTTQSSSSTSANSSSTTTTDQPTEKTPTTGSSGTAQGGATDNHGQATSTNSSQWVISKSGDLTVKAPAANTTVKDGSTVSGSAKVSEVQYRLIDDKVGVLAQGPLGVVNGNFSGTLHFQPHSSSGRLDVFSYDAAGAEINEVQLTLKYTP